MYRHLSTVPFDEAPSQISKTALFDADWRSLRKPSLLSSFWIAALAAALSASVCFRQCHAAEDAVATDSVPAGDVQFQSETSQQFTTIDADSDYADATREEELPHGTFRTRSTGRGSNERLIDRINDPTAWLMDLRFRQSWNWPVEPTDVDSQEIEFRPSIPFVAWDHVNLLRIAVPYNLRGPNGAGLGDIQIYDLVVFEERWGRWGVGPSIRLIPDSGANDDTFQFGPAAGAVAKDKYWTVGVLTLNYLGSDSSQTRIKPILAYKFDEQWSVSLGENEYRYDWQDAIWTQIPLGIQVDYIAEVYGQKTQFFINPQYNFQHDSSNSGWTLFLGLTLLVPDA
jgi:hypothetical protein